MEISHLLFLLLVSSFFIYLIQKEKSLWKREEEEEGERERERERKRERERQTERMRRRARGARRMKGGGRGWNLTRVIVNHICVEAGWEG